MVREEPVGDDVVTVLACVLKRLREVRARAKDAGSWTGPERQAVLGSLDAIGAELGLVRAPVVLAERDAGTSRRVGDASFETAVGRASGKGTIEVRREVRQAEALAAMPAVAHAVASGAMTLAHVDAIGKVAAGANGAAGVDLLAGPGAQAEVVALAAGRDAGVFARDLARFVAERDPDAHERDHATQRRERFLVLSDQPSGTFLKGRLDRFAGERLRLALESTGHAPSEERSREQACADALITLADQALAGTAGTAGDTGAGDGPVAVRVSGAQRRPHVSLLLREETYAALLADQAARVARAERDHSNGAAGTANDRTGEVTGRVGGVAGLWTAVDGVPAGQRSPAPAAVTESGLPVPRSEVAKILCDASVARIVLDANDEPLNLGRSQRLYTGAQRRAVIVRDQHCAYPGCTIPARWAEVHHIMWWERDTGPTSVDNGVLLCERHHHLVHQLDLRITRHRHVDGGARPRRRPGEPGVTYTFRTRTGRLVAPLDPPRPVSVGAAESGSDALSPGSVGPAEPRRNALPPGSVGSAEPGSDAPSPGSVGPTLTSTPAIGCGGPASSPPDSSLGQHDNARPPGRVREPETMRPPSRAGELDTIGPPGRSDRRVSQPSLIDTLIDAQPPDPPF